MSEHHIALRRLAIMQLHRVFSLLTFFFEVGDLFRLGCRFVNIDKLIVVGALSKIVNICAYCIQNATGIL